MHVASQLLASLVADIGMSGAHQQLNASLAIQLCHRWLIEKEYQKEHLHTPANVCTDVSDSFKNGNALAISQYPCMYAGHSIKCSTYMCLFEQ